MSATNYYPTDSCLFYYFDTYMPYPLIIDEWIVMMISWKDVKKALENNKYNGRTVRGIAIEFGVDRSEVESVINENSEHIIRFSNRSDTGEDLFTTREFYQANASSLLKIINAVSGGNTSMLFGRMK
jgi:hypothetical protein